MVKAICAESFDQVKLRTDFGSCVNNACLSCANQ